ncbi:MAG: HD family phosphohydrolase [Gemmatimonadota bacterium]
MIGGRAARWSARQIHRATSGLAVWRPSAEPTAPRDLALRGGLIAALALLTLALFPPRGGYDAPAVRVGLVAPGDIIAPFDFQVLRTDEELEAQQNLAELTVPPVYAMEPASVDSAFTRLETYLGRLEGAASGSSAPALETFNRVEGRSLGLRPAELRALTDADTRAAIAAFAREALPAVYAEHRFLPAAHLGQIAGSQVAVVGADGEVLVARGEISGLRAGAEIPALAARARRLEPDLERIVLQLLPGLMPPSLTARPALTAIRRDEAQAAVDPVKGEILRGELIVAAHTRVSAVQEEKVRALQAELNRRRGGLSAEDARVGLGTFFLNLALLGLLGFYLFFYRRDVFDDFRALAVLAMIWSLITALAAFADRVEAIPAYAVPVALASILIAVLWDARLSVIVTLFLTISLVAQGELGFPLLWTGLLGGLAGAWSVRRIRRRTHFYETLLFVAAAHLVALAALGLIQLWDWGAFGEALGWGAMSAALATFVAMGLLPVLEWASGRTTDLTLLELADLNRPLLKQLLLDAPGTYHHSIIVGNLAESAAESIGANSLLARVGAYYHDIGKVQRPEYFAENQRDGFNPHNQLRSKASARIISRHVPDGVEMARAAGLPERVCDFIREHHGTTRLAYFWNKAEEEDPGAPRAQSDFAYPGPTPRCKETAVVMLADSVEAASRAEREPSPERFREVVRRIIARRQEERQLDSADLTFRDLARIEQQFVSVLIGIHHHRIEYPTVSLHAPEVRPEPAGDVPSVGRTPA